MQPEIEGSHKRCKVTGSAMDILQLQFKSPDTFNASVLKLDKSFIPFTLSCFFDRLNTLALKEQSYGRRK